MTELPKGWAVASFSLIGTWMGGGTPSKAVESFWSGPIPWISPKDMKTKIIRSTIDGITADAVDKSAAKLIPTGSVVIVARSGILAHTLPVAITAIESTLNQDMKALALSKGIESEFVAWGLRAFEQAILNKCRKGGTTVHSIEMPSLIAFEIPIPPTNEQRRIVQKIEAMFEQIDKGVESLRVAKTTLGLYRQSLLKSAFEGRLTAAWRSQNLDKLETPKALLARIQKERETRYKSALDDWQTALSEWRANGEVGRKPGKPSRPDWPAGFDFHDLKALPDGWLYLPFEALAWSIRNGISAKPDGQGPLKIFRISAVRARAFDLEDFRCITDTDGSMSAYRLSYGDLVFTRYNGSRDYVGVSAMYRGDGSHVYPDKLIRCEFKSDLLNPAYLELATNCGESRAHLERLIRTTAGQSGISGGDIKSMPVPICSLSEQAEITRILDARLTAADAMEAEINVALLRAEALRQSILKQAFAGTLVPQDPTDEPAPTLLARIKAERAKAGRAKPARKAKA
jgi:type I restriction enzyme, S subunit